MTNISRVYTKKKKKESKKDRTNSRDKINIEMK